MNLATYLSKIRGVVGDKDLTDTDLIANINWSQIQIAKDFLVLGVRPIELLSTDTSLSTADGVATVTLPTHLWIYTIRVMNDSLSGMLVEKTPEELDALYPDTTETSEDQPIIWVRNGKTTAELFPIPDAVYPLYIRLCSYPTDFANTDDVSTFTGIDEILYTLAVSKTFKDLYEEEDTKSWYATYLNLLKAEVAFRLNRPTMTYTFQPFRTSQLVTGDYWYNPFVKEMP